MSLSVILLMARRRTKRRTRKGARKTRRSKKSSGRRLGKRAGQGVIEDYLNYKNILGGAAAVAAGLGGSASTTKHDAAKWEVAEADGIKFRNYTISYKKSKISRLHEKLSQTGVVYDYAASGVNSTQGSQQAGIVSDTAGTHLTDLYTTLNGAVAITATTESRKMYLGTVGHEIQFSNAGPATLDFDLYILIDKNTMPLASVPGTVWDNGIGQEQFNAVGPSEAKTDLWKVPTTNKLFNITYWTRRLKCSLLKGENCRFNFQFKVNRLMDTQYFKDFESIRGITHSIMVVTRGSLGDGTISQAVTAGQQSITPSKLIWVTKRRWTGSILTQLAKVNRQLGAELPTGILSLYVQEEDADDPEDTMANANYA